MSDNSENDDYDRCLEFQGKKRNRDAVLNKLIYTDLCQRQALNDIS